MQIRRNRDHNERMVDGMKNVFRLLLGCERTLNDREMYAMGLSFTDGGIIEDKEFSAIESAFRDEKKKRLCLRRWHCGFSFQTLKKQ